MFKRDPKPEKPASLISRLKTTDAGKVAIAKAIEAMQVRDDALRFDTFGRSWRLGRRDPGQRELMYSATKPGEPEPLTQGGRDQRAAVAAVARALGITLEWQARATYSELSGEIASLPTAEKAALVQDLQVSEQAPQF